MRYIRLAGDTLHGRHIEEKDTDATHRTEVRSVPVGFR